MVPTNGFDTDGVVCVANVSNEPDCRYYLDKLGQVPGTKPDPDALHVPSAPQGPSGPLDPESFPACMTVHWSVIPTGLDGTKAGGFPKYHVAFKHNNSPVTCKTNDGPLWPDPPFQLLPTSDLTVSEASEPFDCGFFTPGVIDTGAGIGYRFCGEVTPGPADAVFTGWDVQESVTATGDGCHDSITPFDPCSEDDVQTGDAPLNNLNLYPDNFVHSKAEIDYYKTTRLMPCSCTFEQTIIMEYPDNTNLFEDDAIIEVHDAVFTVEAPSDDVTITRDGSPRTFTYIGP